MFEEGFGNPRVFGLKEIQLPEPVSYLPQTAGWFVLFALLFLLLLWLGYKILRHHRANYYRRWALEHLKKIEQAIPDMPPSEVVSSLAILLKRTALAVWPRTQVASLHGEEWLAFLDEGLETPRFVEGSGRALLTIHCGERAPMSKSELSLLLRDARHWIKHHHVGI